MTNEELCALAKTGDKQAAGQLWEQCSKLIYLLFSRLLANPGSAARATAAGVTIEDLTQDGYFAILRAVEGFDPGAGYKFTSYLHFAVKTAFFSAVGMRTEKDRRDPLTAADRLDAPLCNDDGEEVDRYGLIPDPSSGAEMERFEQGDYIQSLHNALESCFARLPEDRADIIRARYFEGRTLAQVGAAIDNSPARVREKELEAMRKLRHPACRRVLAPYHDEVIAQHCYSGTGFGAWKNGGSVEEEAVERMEHNKYS